MPDAFEDPFDDFEEFSPAAASASPVAEAEEAASVPSGDEAASVSVARDEPVSGAVFSLPERRGEMTAAVINPLITATRHVFEVSLGARVERTGLHLYDPAYPIHPISAVIELTGAAYGAVCLNLTRKVAFGVVARMTGETVDKHDAMVRDAVGEITNMIAGNTKAEFENLDLSLGLPRVLLGDAPTLPLPAFVTPVRADFKSDLGHFAVIFAFERAPDGLFARPAG